MIDVVTQIPHFLSTITLGIGIRYLELNLKFNLPSNLLIRCTWFKCALYDVIISIDYFINLLVIICGLSPQCQSTPFSSCKSSALTIIFNYSIMGYCSGKNWSTEMKYPLISINFIATCCTPVDIYIHYDPLVLFIYTTYSKVKSLKSIQFKLLYLHFSHVQPFHMYNRSLSISNDNNPFSM